jgi:16S rRNA (guanine527-N7)-methyltransferase
MEKAEENLELIIRYFADFSTKQLQQFGALGGLYSEWNSMINVISRKDEDSLYEKHILHSLSIAAVFDFTKGMSVLDLGTGGGFPGIPLAIFFPEVSFHLVDSTGKKIKVVQAIADAIGLTNIFAEHIRAEEIRNRKYDCVVSRAVAPLVELLKWSKPLLKGEAGAQKKERRTENEERSVGNEDLSLPVPHGLICLKGGDLTTEIADSGVKPRIMEINEIFARPAFVGKYILYIPSKK